MHIPRRILGLIVVFLALLATCECRRSGYRLPKAKAQGRSASSSSQDVGSGRDLMKKFMMMRGLFQQPPSDVIIISNPTTTTTYTSPSTTTTTTTTPTTNTTGRAFDGQAEMAVAAEDIAIPIATMTALDLEDRLDLPEAEPLVIQEMESTKPRAQQRLRVKNLQRGGQRSQAKPRKKQKHRRVHRHHKKQQKKTPKRGKGQSTAAVNQQRNSESSVNFIEPYHNDRSQKQTSQSGSDSRLQRIWRRFQIAN